MPPVPRLHLSKAKIAVFTALQAEFVAAQKALGATTRDVHPDFAGHVYWLAEVPGFGTTPHVVALFEPRGWGNHVAQHLVVEARKVCPLLQHAIFCGIAGAAPHPSKPEYHVRLGDVVVATEGVFPYTDGKLKDGDEWPTGFELRGRVISPGADSPLVSAADRLRRENMPSHPSRPLDVQLEALVLSIPESSKPSRDELNEPRRSWSPLRLLSESYNVTHPDDQDRKQLRGRPRISHGVIGSANVLQANSKWRDHLRDTAKVRAFEMEGHGFSYEAEKFDIGFLVVRGTSDYCNNSKNHDDEPQRQAYASNVAAAYTRLLLEQLPNQAAKQILKLNSVLRDLVRDSATLPPEEQAELADTKALYEALTEPIFDAGGAQRDGTSTGTSQLAQPPSDPAVLWAVTVAKLVEIENHIKAFDYKQAFVLVDELDDLLKTYPHLLSPDQLRTALHKLATATILRADVTAGTTGKTPIYDKVLEILSRGRRN